MALMHIDAYSETLRHAVRMDVILPDRRGGTGAASAGLPVRDDEIPEI